MREIAIIDNEDAEMVSVNDFFTFSVKYHNLSSTANTIPESERVVVRWITTGIWLIGDDELLVEEDGNWRDVSKELSFFLELHNPDSIHSSISLKMLFNAIVDSIKHDYWKTPFGENQEYSIRISEIAQHYSRKTIIEEQKYIQGELDKVILEDLKRDFINRAPQKIESTPEERMKRGIGAFDILNSLKLKASTVLDPRQAAIDRREKDEKVSITKAIDFTSPLVRKQLVYKKWVELPHIVRSLILLNYKDRDSNIMPQYWDGTDYIQRDIILHAI